MGYVTQYKREKNKLHLLKVIRLSRVLPALAQSLIRCRLQTYSFEAPEVQDFKADVTNGGWASEGEEALMVSHM